MNQLLPCKLDVLLAGMVLLVAANASAAPFLIIRNNYEYHYNGPVTFKTDAPDGYYEGDSGSGMVAEGAAHLTVALPPQSETRLYYKSDRPETAAKGSFSISPVPGAVRLLWNSKEAGRIELGLVVIPGKKGNVSQAVSTFTPLNFSLSPVQEGITIGKTTASDYEIFVKFISCQGGWLDVETEITRLKPGKEQEYVALVRKVSTPGCSDQQMRWNGRIIKAANEPVEGHKDFRYTHGLDWYSWKSNGIHFVTANRFTPGLSAEASPGRWVTAGNFYVQERLLAKDDTIFFVSEIAGPEPGGMPKSAKISRLYTPPLKDETVKLSWRMAAAEDVKPGWEESQFLVTAGYRHVTKSGDAVTVDLGVPYVEFGTSYFPYSTMCENFDFYRTKGLDREGWWPFSPDMWENWKAFIPQMKTDLRIIRSMGFDWARLHHLELLSKMDRKNALDFIDFYMNECRDLGLKVLVDTSGSPEWMTLLAGRYKDVVKRIEIENEVLIPGIKPGDTERWTACYRAAKTAAPDTEVFLTGNCNQAIFERLVRQGVPFDRTGWHCYVHGPGWEETLSSTAVSVASHAADLGRPPVLGEFNWKEITRLSPEARAEKYRLGFGKMLEPRAVPEFLQFHFQETMAVNPEICRQGIRHYETINLDRRPKLEGLEFMKLIRQYTRKDAPVRELPILVEETEFTDGKALSKFSLANETDTELDIEITAESFGDCQSRLVSEGKISLKPGGKASGSVETVLKPESKPGTYHIFVRVDYSGKSSYGWGIVSNPGAPQFDSEPVLADLVEYEQGPSIVDKIDWTKPVCVAFGADSPVLELEMAYLVFNTLQSATGRAVRLCSAEDIPKDFMEKGNLVIVGSPEGNPLVSRISLKLPESKGVI